MISGVITVKQLSSYAYILTLENSDTKKETTYITYVNKFNDENFTISPNNFLYYENISKKEKSKNLEVTFEEYVATIDSITFKMKMKNKTNEEMVINDVKVKLTNGGTITNKFETVTLQPKEEREISFTYEGMNYYIPKTVYVETPKTTILFK